MVHIHTFEIGKYYKSGFCLLFRELAYQKIPNKDDLPSKFQDSQLSSGHLHVDDHGHLKLNSLQTELCLFPINTGVLLYFLFLSMAPTEAKGQGIQNSKGMSHEVRQRDNFRDREELPSPYPEAGTAAWVGEE